MALASIMAFVPGAQDVTISFVPGQSILFTCQPGGEVFGLACQLPAGKISKTLIASYIADLMVSCPQTLKDKLTTGLSLMQTQIGAV